MYSKVQYTLINVKGKRRAMVFTMESAQHPPSTSTSHTPVTQGPSSSVTFLGLSVMPAPAAGALGIFNIQPLPPHLPSCFPSISKFNYINRFSFKQLRIFLIFLIFHSYIHCYQPSPQPKQLTSLWSLLPVNSFGYKDRRNRTDRYENN